MPSQFSLFDHFRVAAERVADLMIDRRRLAGVMVLAMTVLAAIGHYDPYLILPEPVALTESRSDSSSASDGAAIQPPSVEPVQVAAGDVIVVARCEEFFSPAGADAIRDAVASLELLPHVRRVMWMDRAPMLNIFGLSEPILPRRNATQVRFDAARDRALDHPLVAGQLLARDANTMLLMVSIDWLYVTADEDCTDLLRETATAAAAQHPGIDMSFQVTGSVPIRLSRATSNRANEMKYQAIGYSIALIIAFILFRGLSSVIIVALAPTLGVFWTLGILHFLGWNDNPFNTVIVPVLLCMVGFTDGVHMMVQIRKHRSAGMSAPDAARTAIREVGLACWLTSLTTAIGFGSLVLAHHEMVREFGYCCVIGVLTTFVAVITVIPLACASRLGRHVHAGYGRNLVDQNLERIAGVIDFVLRKHVVLGWIAIVSTAAMSVVTLQLRPDERLTSNLAASSEAAEALSHIDSAFGGMEVARVEVSWSESAVGSGEIMQVVGEAESALRTEPLIGNPLSIHSLVKALPGEGDPVDRMSMLELLPPQLKRAYYVPETRHAEVSFRTQDIGIASYGEVFERTERRLAEIQSQHPEFQLTLSGNAVHRWRDLYRIVVDLAFSLGTATAIIFVVLSLVYRSLRIGLISIVPNLFPLAATGLLLYVTGQHLEIVSVCAFTVCLGIAVDDTIHFLTRFQEEDVKTSDRAAAIRQSFVGVGTALIMTTLVLVIGFSTALFSDARDFRIFAAMGVLTIGCALFADLLFLPALLLRYAPKK